jgi:L-rhamnose-H+ transport protein
MEIQILAGAAIVLVAGILQGLFAVPMKFARRWNYENIWLVFALVGLVIFPWVLTLATVPQIGEVYRLVSTK